MNQHGTKASVALVVRTDLTLKFSPPVFSSLPMACVFIKRIHQTFGRLLLFENLSTLDDLKQAVRDELQQAADIRVDLMWLYTSTTPVIVDRESVFDIMRESAVSLNMVIVVEVYLGEDLAAQSRNWESELSMCFVKFQEISRNDMKLSLNFPWQEQRMLMQTVQWKLILNLQLLLLYSHCIRQTVQWKLILKLMVCMCQ